MVFSRIREIMIKKIFFVIAFAAAAVAASALVKPGVETLRDNGFKVLEGKRVGLITNPTGVDNNLKSTVDILHEAANVKLVALYGPEHGVRGDVHAGDKVGDSTDPATGVKVYSLYGKTRKPTKEMLKDIDVLVYDIQDIGCRSFTFISTMGVAMEACAEQGKECGARPSESTRRLQGGGKLGGRRLHIVCEPVPDSLSLRTHSRRACHDAQ